jgi:hypothetical protein
MRAARLVPVAAVSAILLFRVDTPARAADGRLEINQACAGAGCLPGDTAGFPIQVTQPGSYVLTSELVAPPMTRAIEVTGSSVRIDLNGFRVLGDGTGTADGIHVTGVHVEISHGTVENFGGHGIRVAIPGFAARVVDVKALDNGDNGVSAGLAAVVEDTEARANGVHGIGVADNSAVSRCRAIGNGGNGFVIGIQSLIADSMSVANDESGYIVFDGSIVRGNVATLNDAAGFLISPTSLVTNNLALANGGVGLTAGMGSIVVDNQAP